MKTFTCVALVLALVLAACGGEDGSADGAAVSIDEALAGDSDEPLLVTGNLLAQGGGIRLCSALAESFPPQCGGASLVVDGLELEGVNGLVTEGDVSWTDRPIELLGGCLGRDAGGEQECGLMAVEHPQGWNEVRGALQRGFRFEDFAEAIAFVNRLAEAAEEANHHPDIAISWNAVTVRWWTHVKREITERDVELARRTDELASSFSQR